MKLCLILTIVLLSNEARADHFCSAKNDTTSKMSSTQRSAYMKAWLRRDSRWMPIWHWGWIGLNTATTVSSIVFAALPNQTGRKRGPNIIWAVSGGISVASYFIFPTEVVTVPFDLANVEDPDCLQLEQLEHVFEKTAANEYSGTSWIAHVVFASLNLPPMIAILAAYPESWVMTLIYTAIGIVLGEVGIWTQPTGVLRARAAYENGDLSRLPGKIAFNLHVAPVFGVYGIGVSTGIGFTF